MSESMHEIGKNLRQEMDVVHWEIQVNLNQMPTFLGESYILNLPGILQTKSFLYYKNKRKKNFFYLQDCNKSFVGKDIPFAFLL